MKTNNPELTNTPLELEELQSVIDEKRQNKNRAIDGLHKLHKDLISQSYTDITQLDRLKTSGRLKEMILHITKNRSFAKQIEQMDWTPSSKPKATVQNLKKINRMIQNYTEQQKKEIVTLDTVQKEAQQRLIERETAQYNYARQLKAMLDTYHLKPLTQILNPDSVMPPEQELETFIRHYTEIDSQVQKLKDIKYDQSITKTKKREVQSDYLKRVQHL